MSRRWPLTTHEGHLGAELGLVGKIGYFPAHKSGWAGEAIRSEMWAKGRSMGKHTRRAAKRDDNERGIVDALRAAGAFVQPLDAVDLLVGYRGRWVVMEVKDPAKPFSQQKLTFDQVKLIERLRNRAPLHVVQTPEQALAVIQEAK